MEPVNQTITPGTGNLLGPVTNLYPVTNRVATYVGLALSLFGIQAIVLTFRLLSGNNHSNTQIVLRELTIFALVGLLLWLVVKWERLPLASVGLHATRLGRSIGWGLAMAVPVFAVTIVLYFLLKALGISLGTSDAHAFKPSLWVVALTMLRAGVAEEICFRGYSIERLDSLTNSRLLAAVGPLLVFAALHYRQGLGGVIAALVLGGVFTVFYLKRRDIVSNITAHFLVDFILNVALAG